MKRYFCTYFDYNYLMYGLTLFRSLQNTHDDFSLFVLCLDDKTYQALLNLDQKVVPLALQNLEQFDPELQQCQENRSRIEYYFTISPCLPRYIFMLQPEIDLLVYLDADLYFFSSTESIFNELGDKSILITAHNFYKNADYELAMYGKFNVAFQIYRNNDVGRQCLEWWREKCLEWCYDRAENGKFADQKYLEQWPLLWGEQVLVSQNPGVNLAPWNIMHYADKILLDSNAPLIGANPIVFVHYQGLKVLSENTLKWNFHENVTVPRPIWKFLYEKYFNEAMRTRLAYKSLFPQKINYDDNRKKNLPETGRVEKILQLFPEKWGCRRRSRKIYVFLRNLFFRLVGYQQDKIYRVHFQAVK